MPLLGVVQISQISASVRLTDIAATQVDQYAAFIRACADDVVEQALAYVFSKDRDFQDFLKTPEARKVSSTLRIRKASAAGGSSAALPEASLVSRIGQQARRLQGGAGVEATCFDPDPDERVWTSDVVIETRSKWEGCGDGAQASASERLTSFLLRDIEH